MCGINFIINKKEKNLDKSHINWMNHAIFHRGPDYQHFLEIKEQQQLFFGHTRLEILDKTSASHQPFVSENERYFLVFNGEIYNFLALKKQLQHKGIVFKSEGDTEVLFNWLIYKGIEFIAQLEGMFAFVFYDKLKNKTWIVRDKSGMKPVFYYQNDDFFILSSESEGILKSKLVDEKLNENQIGHYLFYKFPSKGTTFFEGIQELENGNVLVLQDGKIQEKYKYYQTHSKIIIDDHELLEIVEKRLLESVDKHLQVDVPMGLFLSGGVDSTLLLALLQEKGYEKFPTFSISHQANEESFGTQDYIYTQKAAKQYNSNHQELLFDSSILSKYDDFLANINQPIGDGAFFLTHLLSEFASKSVKAVWSGAGADEYFAGYNRHQAFDLYLKYFSTHQNRLSLFQKMGEILPTGFNHPLRKHFRLFQKFALQVNKNPQQTFLNFTKLNFPTAILKKPFLEEMENSFQLDNALVYDQENFLIADVLNLSDQMTMQHGMEMRMPFLDTNLVNLMEKISSKQLLKHGKKWVLKELLKKRGGEIYANRKKEGFGVPFGEWIRKNQKFIEFLKDPQLKIYDFVDYKQIQLLVNNHLLHHQDYTMELWSLILLAKWLMLKKY